MIRPLASDDVAACAEVAAAALRPAGELEREILGAGLAAGLGPGWRARGAEAFERYAGDAEARAWVAEEDGEVAGFVFAYQDDDTGLGHVSLLGVAPERQGRGHGTALLERALGELRRAGMAHAVTMIRSYPAHDAARRLLARAGFARAAIQTVQYHRVLEPGGPAEPPPGVRRITAGDVAPCRRFGVEAFRPVFASFEEGYGADLFHRLRPGWEAAQGDYIEAACRDPGKEAWVHAVDGAPFGLLVLVVDDRGVGQLELLAVDPDHQGRGVGTALTVFALDRLRAAGMAHAVVATGDDPGHAAARRAYERRGFRPLPIQPVLLVAPLGQ